MKLNSAARWACQIVAIVCGLLWQGKLSATASSPIHSQTEDQGRGIFSFSDSVFYCVVSGEESAEIRIHRTGDLTGPVELNLALHDDSNWTTADKLPIRFGDQEQSKSIDLIPIIRSKSLAAQRPEIPIRLSLSTNSPQASLGNLTLATLVTHIAPQVIAPPARQIAYPRESIEFSVSATAAPKPIYQWLKDGVPLNSATNATLTIPRASDEHAGLYTVIISNPLGSISADATLTINPLKAIPPFFLTPPSSQAVLVQGRLNLFVEAAGPGSLQYQWFKNNQPIPDATTPELVITNVHGIDAGHYTVQISNPYGSITSPSAEVSVTIGIPPTLTMMNTNLVAHQGTSIELVADAEGTQPISFQWHKNNQPIGGATNRILTINNARPSDSGQYFVHAKNIAGDAKSSEVSVLVYLPLSVGFHPFGRSVNKDEQVLLYVGAVGTPPFTYQWLKDGIPIPDSNDPFFTLSRVQPNDSGHYSAVVRDGFGGEAASREAQITVLHAPIIATTISNLSRTVGDDAAFEMQVAGKPPFAFHWFKDGASLAQTSTPSLVLTNLQLSHSGVYHLVVSNSAGQATSAPFTLLVEAKILVPGDFNLDGSPDILFRDQAGFLTSWGMDGLEQKSVTPLMPDRLVDMSWKCVGIGDFNQDGYNDLLFQHTDGTMAQWMMRGLRQKSASFLSPAHPGDIKWRIAAVGDFDRDQHPDLLFQHADGTIAIWHMNMTKLASGVYLTPERPGNAELKVRGTADFNNDGNIDIIFQSPDGSVSIWLLEGTRRIEERQIATEYPTESGNRVVSTLDRNNDTRPDLLFRHTDGTLSIWMMDGTSVIEAALLTPSTAPASSVILGAP